MFRGYKLFKVQSLYSLNLRPISGDGDKMCHVAELKRRGKWGGQAVAMALGGGGPPQRKSGVARLEAS